MIETKKQGHLAAEERKAPTFTLKARHKRHNSKKRHETIVTTSHPDADNGRRN